MRIIDIHQHFGPWPFSSGWNIERAMKHLKRVGVETAVGSSPEALCYDFRSGNRNLNSIVEQHDELFGYLVLNPNYPEMSLEELEKYCDNPNFIGVKIHPDYHGKSLDSEAYLLLYEQIENLGWPVLSHTNPGDVSRVRTVVKNFRNLVFIMGHMGTGGLIQPFRGFKEAVQLAQNSKNVYLEISTMPQTRIIEYAVKTAGSEKILFGSDFILDCPSFMYPMVTEAKITDDEKKNILYRNAERLFELPEGFQ